MLKRGGVSVLFLTLCISCACAAGIDDDYIKPESGKWGDVLERLLGQKGFGKSYALVIGVGDYDHYKKLSAPAADAEQVRNFLRDEAQFDRIITLTDEKATRARIESLMERILPQFVQNNDRFLFYFSGHGMTRDLGALKRGYLILKTSQRGGWDEMIDMPRMRDWAQNFGNARHVLFLLDACFSGLAAAERKDGFDPKNQTIQRLMQPASHIVIAGIEGEESFIFNEKSLFTAAFLAAARGYLALPNDGVISLSEMMVQINRALDAKRAELNDKLKMTPRSYYSRIENNAGEFFFLPNSIPRSNNPAPSVSAALERKSDIPPASVQAYLSRGVEYGEKNDLDRAIAEFSEAIRLDPKHALAFYNRGKAYGLKKDYDRAIADYTEAIRLDPGYATAFYNRGNTYAVKKDYDRAIADYTDAIRLNPRYAEAFTNRGNQYAHKKEYDRAIADYTDAIRLDPKHTLAFYNRGNAYADKKEYDRAIADYTEAIRLDPRYADAFYNRGNQYAHKKEYDRAIADYNEAIRLGSKDAKAKREAAEAEQQRLAAKAEEERKAKAGGKNPELVFYNRGNEYADKGDLDRAIAEYNEALRINPNFNMALANRGLAYSEKGDIERALADYNEAIRLVPENAVSVPAFINRGHIYAKKGDIERALADYNEAVRLDPNDSRTFANRGGAYLNNGDYDRAIKDFNEAIRIEPKVASRAAIFANRGLSYARNGDIEQALADYNEAIRLDPKSARTFCNRGILKLKFNDDAGGKADMAKARELDASICQ
jgi:tetratricopeptide (TPR) repeat protein